MKRLTLIMATVAASVLSVFSLSASERCLCDMSAVYQNDYYSFTMVEEKPTFNGDSAVTFTQWIMENLKKPDGVSGMMVVEFIIGTDGKLSDIKVLRSLNPEIDAEVVKLISSSPQWTPGKQGGKAVRVKYMQVVRL